MSQASSLSPDFTLPGSPPRLVHGPCGQPSSAPCPGRTPLPLRGTPWQGPRLLAAAPPGHLTPSPHLRLHQPSRFLWARAGEAPQQGGRAVSGPQFDSPFRALLPSGHCPPQNPPWLPLPTPGPHPLRHHNSFAKLPLNHLTRKQSYVYIHCYKNKIGTGMSSGVCCHHQGPGGQGDGSGVQVHPLQNGIQPDQDLTLGLSPGCFQPSRQPGTQASSHHKPAGPGMPPEPCRLLN